MATWGLRNSLVNYYHGLCTRGVIETPPNVDAILASYAGEWLQLNEDLTAKYGYGFIDAHPQSSTVSSAVTSKAVSPNASFDRPLVGPTPSASSTKVGTPTGWKMVEAEEPPSNSSIVQKHRSIEVDFSNLSFQPSAQSFAGHADAGSGSVGGGHASGTTPSASARWSATSQHESTPGPHPMGSGPASPTMVYPSKGTPVSSHPLGQPSTPSASVHFSPSQGAHGSSFTSPVRNSSFTGASSTGFFGSNDSGRFVASNDWNAPPSFIQTQSGSMRRPRSESQSSKVSIASSGGGSGNGRLASASASRAGGATLSPAQMSTQLLQSVGRSKQQLLSEQQILGTFSQTPTFDDAFDEDD